MRGVPQLEQDRIDGLHLIEFLKYQQKENAICSWSNKEKVDSWISNTQGNVEAFAPHEAQMYRTITDNLDFRQGETQHVHLIPVVSARIEKLRRIIGRKEAQAYNV